MSTRGEEHETAVLHSIHDAMLVGQAARPGVWLTVLEWLGLADPSKRIAVNGLNEVS